MTFQVERAEEPVERLELGAGDTRLEAAHRALLRAGLVGELLLGPAAGEPRFADRCRDLAMQRGGRPKGGVARQAALSLASARIFSIFVLIAALSSAGIPSVASSRARTFRTALRLIVPSGSL